MSRHVALQKLPKAAPARGAHAPSRVLAGALAGQSVFNTQSKQTNRSVIHAPKDSASAFAPHATRVARSVPWWRAISLRALWLLAVALFSVAGRAENNPEADETNTKPDRAEFWVPANRLSSVLAKYPKAVLMSRAQYETLLREAAPPLPAPDAPPVDAALTAASYHGKVEGKVLTVEGELTARVLTGDWARLPLRFGELCPLAEVKVDGGGALALPVPPPATGEAKSEPVDADAPALLLRGRGPHKISVRFASPIVTTEAWHGAALGLPAAGATSLVIDFPPHTLADCAQPLRTEELPEGTRVTVALPLNSSEVLLRWRSSGGGLVALPPSLESKTAFVVDAEAVQARSDLTVSTATGTLPETLELLLAPGTRLVEVTGSDIAGWTAEGQRVALRLPPGRGARAEFSTVVQQATGLAQAPAEVPLPLPELAGAGRVEGEFRIYSGPGVAVRELANTPGATPLPPENGVAGHWRFLGPTVAPKLRVERLRPRFSADLDTLVDFQPEAIFIERTVTLHPEEGGIFNLLLTLPAGEEVLTVRGGGPKPDPAEPDPLWQVEGGRLSLRWLGDPRPGHLRAVWVRTRVEPAGWAAGVGRTASALPAAAPAETFNFPVAEVKIEGAEKVSGYLALRASENFRLETTAADTLEPRDGRTTPVTGAYAWFRRGEFDLKVRVTRRPSELLATLTGYALPLAGVLDLHAQIAWDFRYSGVRSVQVRVPGKQADLFYFDGPQIAEKTLAGDTWTLVFQKELTGRQVVTVTAQIPVARDADDPSRFTTAIPVLEPLHAQRSGGTWVIEANTDTEIQLTATGMNELDAPLAPPLAGYQPRHRVIGVFTWLGPTYGLGLSGVRHAGAEVLKTVVDSLEVASVVATSGTVRSEAALQVRTAGAQFLDITLPQSARLLSLLVDDEPSKPVEGRPGEVRVQLPAKADPGAMTELVILYEYVATPEWQARGQSTLEPLRLPHDVPVLKTKWRAFLPKGYYYSGATSNLAPAPPRWEKPLLFAPRELWKLSAVATRFPQLFWSPRGGISSPSQPPSVLPGQMKIINRVSRLGGFGQVDGPGDDFTGQAKESPLRDQDSEASGQISAEAQNGTVGQIRPVPVDSRENLDRYNTTRAPEFRSRVEQVKQYVIEARGFLEVGRYDLAGQRCEQILALDPYNIAARKLQAQVNKKREEYSASQYDQARAFALWQTQKSWDHPVRRFGEPPRVAGSGRIFSSGGTTGTSPALNPADYPFMEPAPTPELVARVQRKLDTIIVPRLEFRESTLREAVKFLRQKSRELDVMEPDLSRRGVNITLRLDAAATPSTTPTPSNPSTIPGLAAIPGANQPAAVPAFDPSDTRITIALTNLPLGEALRYVTNLAGSKFKVLANEVVVVPLSVAMETLITKEWKVPPGFMSETNQSGDVGSKTKDARDHLTAAGITFPPGSSAIFLPGSGQLIVRNTQENLDMIDNITENALISGPLSPANLPLGGEQARQVGLLPMRLELPKIGEEMVVEGFGAPEPMELKYFALESRARWLWLAFLVGALAYAIGGGRHPWWRTAWVILWLTALPLCVWPALTTLCNLWLGGWLVALVVGRLTRRFIFIPEKEAMA